MGHGFLVTETGHRTYTLHRLVRAFAEKEALRLDPTAANALLSRTARHLESVGELKEAVSLYFRCGEVEAAVPALRRLASISLNAADTYTCDEWLELVPDGVMTGEPWLLLAKGRIVQGRGNYREAEPLYRAAGRLFHSAGDDSGSSQALLGQAFCLYMTGRWDDSLAALSRAQSVASEPAERAEVLAATGVVLTSQCRWDEAVEKFELSLATAAPPERRSLEVRINMHRARLFFLRGRFKTALDWAWRAVRLGANESGPSYASAFNIAATALYLTGRYEEAAIQADASYGLVVARGLAFIEAPVLLSLGAVAHGKGDYRTALANIRRAQEISQAAGDAEADVWAEDMLADVCRRNHNPERALERHRRALEAIEREQLAVFERVRVLCGVGMDLAVRGGSRKPKLRWSRSCH